jgi:tRNA/rRNA methyltransferase
MRNLGVELLVLVAPEVDRADPRGRLLATHSEDIIDRARVVGDLGKALAGCGLAAATSARLGGLFRRQSAGTPDVILPQLAEAMTTRPVALVFGPEASGLTDPEISRCHFLINVPTVPAHPALNLAQAVAICLYELRLAWLKGETTSPPQSEEAPFEDRERMFVRLRAALEDIHFLYGAKADSLMHALRHLIGRARPSSMEVKLLLGLARQLRWISNQAQCRSSP